MLNLISLRQVASGRVVATAASLRDLMPASTLRASEASATRLFRELLDLNPHTPAFIKKADESNQFRLGTTTALYPAVVKKVSFVTRATGLGLLAFLFVGAYIVLATLASWWWLRGRSMAHLSWTVFAGFAVAASALSLLGASTLRGFSDLNSLSVLDLDSGATTARGFCMFGYRSPTRQQPELSLPGENNFLRPLAKAPAPQMSSYYVTPTRYGGVPTKATLNGVLIRATLKQVEGWWHGECGGTIRGDLVADRNGRITPASWLANDMAVDIEGGLLLYVDPRISEPNDPRFLLRAAGVSRFPAVPDLAVEEDLKGPPPASSILALRVPPLRANQQISDLGGKAYADVDQAFATWSSRPPLKRSVMLARHADLRTLWDEQQEWLPNQLVARALDWRTAVLLASTRSYYLACAGAGRGLQQARPDADDGAAARPGYLTLARSRPGGVAGVGGGCRAGAAAARREAVGRLRRSHAVPRADPAAGGWRCRGGWRRAMTGKAGTQRMTVERWREIRRPRLPRQQQSGISPFSVLR